VVINQDSAVAPAGQTTPGQVYDQYLSNSSSLTVVGGNNVTVSNASLMINNNQIDGFIVIPVNFSRSFTSLTPISDSKINVTVDNTNLMVSQALQGIAAQLLNDTLHDPRVASWYKNVTHGLTFRVPGSSIDYINQYSSGYSFIDFLAPGIVAMTVLFTSLFAAGMPVILDREVGYFDMLLSTPVKRSELVLGFTLAGVTKVVAQATFVLVIAVILGIHMALNPLSILYIYVLVALLALGFVGISMALSVKIELTAFQFVNGLINFPVFFLSGAFYPIESLPDWLKSVVLVNPMTYAVSGLRAVMIKGTSLLTVIPDVIIVGIFALLTTLLGNLALYLSLSGKHIRIRHRGQEEVTTPVATEQQPSAKPEVTGTPPEESGAPSEGTGTSEQPTG
jgi:ABC-2 type transport system permease protein